MSASQTQKSSRRPTAIDLFSGCGGLSLGLEQSGFDIVAAVEYDPVHAAVHEFNFPLTETVCADISTLSPERLRNAAIAGATRHRQTDAAGLRGEVDVIVGGPPCQGFSTMGKRLIDDPRNELIFHFFRLIAALRPRYFVMENVPGMKAGGHASLLTRLVAEFEREGYRVPPSQVLNASDFGVAQDRRRLVLIGSRDDQALAVHPPPQARPVPKTPEARLRTHDKSLPLGPTVSEAIGDLPDLDRFEQLWQSDRVGLSEEELAVARRRASAFARRLRGEARDRRDLSYPRPADPSHMTSSARTRHTDVSIARFAATTPGDTERISRFFRLHPDGLSNTLRAGTGSERGAHTSPRPLHPWYPRVISVREAARLHSFPDWFRLHATKWHGFRQIGNAVAPLVGRAIGEALIEALAAAPAQPRRRLPLGEEALLRMTMAQAAAHFGAAPEAIPAQRVRRILEPAAA